MRLLLQTLLIALILITADVFAQYGKIAGYIKDGKTGEALVGANVIVEGTPLGAATNLDGYYAIVNATPGTYTIKVSLIGYNSSSVVGTRVNIDQTTELNVTLNESSITTAEVVIVATQPVVQKDVSYSRVNLNIEEIQNLPVVSAARIIGLQAGIQAGASGPLIRGGSADQSAFMLNGLTLRDERDNTPYTGISFTSIEDIQIQTGGFNAEYGNIRAGLITATTKEGKKDRYSVSILGRYSPIAQKHFGHSPNDIESYWVKPYVDPSVCWTGTQNGAWDEFKQKQFPQFEGWISIAEKTLKNNDPNDDLTPQAAQRVYLWQFRRLIDIRQPDYDIDATVAGPVPGGKYLGDLRFAASYRQSQNMLLIPLATDWYRDFNFQGKVTSDIYKGMKLSFDILFGEQRGTNITRSGGPGIFSSTSGVASVMNNEQYTNSRIFSPSYFSPSVVKRDMQGLKFTHALSSTTFYEFSLSRFASNYSTVTDRWRDTSMIYKFGNNYYIDEAPFGMFDGSYKVATGINGLRTTIGFGDSRDTSKTATYTAKFDFVSQLDKYNQIKTGFEFVYSDNNVNYWTYDKFLPTSISQSTWHKYPVRGAIYAQDKLEFEGMIANVGVRLDYANAGGDWYDYDTFTSAFSAENSSNINELLTKSPTKKILNVSPRLGVAFPISENSKLFFNYGHFRQMPDPNNLYLLRIPAFLKNVTRIADPNNPLPRTIQYELGFEQNLIDQFLIRLAGFYKDNSLQSYLVSYVSRDSKVSYSVSRPNSYSDIRGFEATVTKNRGNWIQGFVNYTYQVTTSGHFGFATYYQNQTAQRANEASSLDSYVSKPKPSPYARFNVDLFTPREFGPKFAGFYLLEDWRLNLLGVWNSGGYDTWVGGGSLPGVVNNVQWLDFYNLDLRLSKTFNIGPANIQFFVDVSNVFNYKDMNDYAWFNGNDRQTYFNSLHLSKDAFVDFPKNADGTAKVPWTNWTSKLEDGTPTAGYEYGDDRPGDYRKGPYIPWDPNASGPQKEEWKKNKSYIDMPNQEYLTFLNPRDIFWGIKVNFEIF